VSRARQRAELATERAQRDQEAEDAQIGARQAIDAAKIRSEQTLEQERIAKERAIQAAEIERRKALELAEQQRAIAVARESEAQSLKRRPRPRVPAREAVAAEEKVFTVREVEGRAQEGHRPDRRPPGRRARGVAPDAVAPPPRRRPAPTAAAAIRAQAEADADAEKIRTIAARIRAEAEADATRMMNEAQNVLSPEARASVLRLKLVEKAEAIIRESVRPMERIEGIKILHVDGLAGGGGGGGDGGGGGFADGVVNSALRFRARRPSSTSCCARSDSKVATSSAWPPVSPGVPRPCHRPRPRAGSKGAPP
jgi:uncharacterized membrane protein YqiK